MSSQEPLELDPNIKSTFAYSGLSKQDDRSDDDDPISSMPLSPNGGFKTQFPAVQTMELSPNDHSPASTSYRIPSRVFTRKKSTAPTEWSVASNESLFSIHTGSMSFTRDNLSWLDKSEEMIFHSDSSQLFSGPLLDLSSDHLASSQPALDMSAEVEKHNAIVSNVGGPDGVVTPKLVEPRKGVKHENVDERTKEVLLSKGVARCSHSCRASTASGASVKSFAFPILSRNDTSGSITPKKNRLSQTHSDTQSLKEIQQSDSLVETQREPLQKEEIASKPTPSGARCTWFSCFTGCSRCS